MKKAQIFSSILLASAMLLSQVAAVFAAPDAATGKMIAGEVTQVTLDTDTSTGVVTVLVTVKDENGGSQTVRVSEQTAYDLGLLDYDDDGNPFIVDPLPASIEISFKDVLAEEGTKNPVGTALATFFSDIKGLDYDAIMEARADGFGFGVIAQALWLTRKLEGDATVFGEILQAKRDGDFSLFTFKDGTSPTNWGQFRKAVLGGDNKGSLGVAMSQKTKDQNGNGTGNNGVDNPNSNKNKGKPDKGNGNGNGGDKGKPKKP